MRSGGQRQMTAASRFLMIAAVLACLGSHPFAHDLERTEVTLTFEADGSFVLDVANDPDWLLLRLEPFATEAAVASPPWVRSASPNDIAKRDARLASFAPVVIDRVVLWVDGREVRPASAEFIRPARAGQAGWAGWAGRTWGPAFLGAEARSAKAAAGPRRSETADDLSPLGIYRLRGRMATDVRSLRWFYGIVIDPYPMIIRRADGRVVKETILGKAWSETIDLAGQFERRSPLSVMTDYFVLGYQHVVTRGVDHMLFVLGLLLLSLRFRPAAAQIAAFTFAQSIAVLSTMYGFAAAPARAIWPIVLLSIAYVFVENLLTRTLTSWRLVFVFVFGLFHGAQLASVLTAVGVPRARIGSSVLAFNVGVISAELTVVLVVVMAAAALRAYVGSGFSRITQKSDSNVASDFSRTTKRM